MAKKPPSTSAALDSSLRLRKSPVTTNTPSVGYEPASPQVPPRLLSFRWATSTPARVTAGRYPGRYAQHVWTWCVQVRVYGC